MHRLDDVFGVAEVPPLRIDRSDDESSAHPSKAPLQTKLRVLARLAAGHRADLWHEEIDELAFGHPARVEPVLNLRREPLHRVVKLLELFLPRFEF